MAATIATMSLSAMRRESSRTADRIRKRVSRLEAKGVRNSSTEAFRAIESFFSPDGIKQERARLRELRRLDRSSATRASGAARAARADARDATARALVSNPRAVPGRQELDDLFSTKLRNVRANAAKVEKEGGTYATTLFREFESDLAREGAMTDRRKAAATRRLLEIDSFKGIKLTGAREETARGTAAFGADYATWSHEQRGAAWKAMREKFEEGNRSWSSKDILAAAWDSVRDGTMSTSFYREGPSPADLAANPNHPGRLVATIADTQSEADRDAAIRRHNKKMQEEARRTTKGASHRMY